MSADNGIVIKLTAFDKVLLEKCVASIVSAAISNGSSVSGPIPIPTIRELYTVLSSPHINKTSREQFEIRTHRRILCIKECSDRTIDALMGIEVPSGIEIKLKVD